MDMTMYYTIDERYLNALDAYLGGEYAKSKVLLEQLLDEEPGYAKAHFVLGVIYHDELRDLKKAESSYQFCIKFDPHFPDVYLPYMLLLRGLGKQDELEQLAKQALNVGMVCKSCIHQQLAQSYERNQQFSLALDAYHQAYLLDTSECVTDFVETKNRILKKMMLTQEYRYQLT